MNNTFIAIVTIILMATLFSMLAYDCYVQDQQTVAEMEMERYD